MGIHSDMAFQSLSDKSFIIVKLTSELSLRGSLTKYGNKYAMLVSNKLSNLEKYKTAFTSSTSFKNIYIITKMVDLADINLNEVCIIENLV